jgi:hypothetical protein
MRVPMNAQTLEEFLPLNPDVTVESKDDAKCKAFLGGLGILEHFTRSKEPNLSALTFYNHPTHWIVGLLWSGYAKPEHNGYQLVCLPKSRIPEGGAKDFVQYMMEKYGGHDQEDGVIRLPWEWRRQN